MAEDCVIPCGVALVRRGRQFLISQRHKDDTFGLKWEFPGGKKDPHETFEECVAREVMEETGIEVQVHGKFMEVRRRYHERVIWLNFYLCTYLSGEPRPVECAQVLWADIDELANYDFPPANDAVIKKLLSIVDGP